MGGACQRSAGSASGTTANDVHSIETASHGRSAWSEERSTPWGPPRKTGGRRFRPPVRGQNGDESALSVQKGGGLAGHAGTLPVAAVLAFNLGRAQCGHRRFMARRLSFQARSLVWLFQSLT